jgi:hypothetical protein
MTMVDPGVKPKILIYLEENVSGDIETTENTLGFDNDLVTFEHEQPEITKKDLFNLEIKYDVFNSCIINFIEDYFYTPYSDIQKFGLDISKLHETYYQIFMKYELYRYTYFWKDMYKVALNIKDKQTQLEFLEDFEDHINFEKFFTEYADDCIRNSVSPNQNNDYLFQYGLIMKYIDKINNANLFYHVFYITDELEKVERLNSVSKTTLYTLILELDLAGRLSVSNHYMLNSLNKIRIEDEYIRTHLKFSYYMMNPDLKQADDIRVILAHNTDHFQKLAIWKLIKNYNKGVYDKYMSEPKGFEISQDYNKFLNFYRSYYKK